MIEVTTSEGTVPTMDRHVDESPAAIREPGEVGELADVMTRTIPDNGLDRMTGGRVEELLAVPALTAHL